MVQRLQPKHHAAPAVRAVRGRQQRHILTCADFVMLHFYSSHPYGNGLFQYVLLPTRAKMRQDLLQPWEMRISLIWEPPACSTGPQCTMCRSCDDELALLPPGA